MYASTVFRCIHKSIHALFWWLMSPSAYSCLHRMYFFLSLLWQCYAMLKNENHSFGFKFLSSPCVLLGRCEKGVMSSVNVRNCIRFYQTAEELDATTLMNYCGEIIASHWVSNAECQGCPCESSRKLGQGWSRLRLWAKGVGYPSLSLLVFHGFFMIVRCGL